MCYQIHRQSRNFLVHNACALFSKHPILNITIYKQKKSIIHSVRKKGTEIMVDSTEQGASSLLETIKNSTLLTDSIAKLKSSKEVLFWGLLYGGIGFLAGFFFKHYNRALLLFLCFIGILVGLHYAGFLTITINHEKITNLLGVQSTIANDQITHMLCEWIKNNIYIAITLTVGFILGVWAS